MALPTVSLHSNGPYWHAVWPDPLNPARRRRRSIGPKRRLSRVEAVSACARIAAEIALEAAGGLPTLDSLDSRIVSTRVGLKPGSLKLLRRSVALLCQWADEALPAGRRSRIDDITRAGATAFHRWLTDRGNPGTDSRRMAQTTVTNHLRLCRAIWNWVIDDLDDAPIPGIAPGYVLRNPWARRGWRVPKIAHDWVEVTPEMLERVMDACQHEGIRTMLALCRYAGLRAGEARRLRHADIDLARRTLRILPAADHAGRRSEGTKQRERYVPICPRLAEILAQSAGGHRPTPTPTAPVCGKLPNVFGVRRYLIGGPAGGRRRKDGKQRRYVGAIERAGLTPWSKPLHTLRRNCGTAWAEQGIPLADVAKWMGNSVSVAADYYVRTTPITFARITGLPQTQPQTPTPRTSRKPV